MKIRVEVITSDFLTSSMEKEGDFESGRFKEHAIRDISRFLEEEISCYHGRNIEMVVVEVTDDDGRTASFKKECNFQIEALPSQPTIRDALRFIKSNLYPRSTRYRDTYDFMAGSKSLYECTAEAIRDVFKRKDYRPRRVSRSSAEAILIFEGTRPRRWPPPGRNRPQQPNGSRLRSR